MLYTIGKILCPTTGITVNAKYLSLVDSVQKVKSINWAKLTLDYLLESVAKFKLGKANLEGNLHLLQLWYWEKLRVTQDATLDYTERKIPLMQYWTEEKARKVDKIDEQYNFGAGTLVDDYMKPPPAKKKSSKAAPIPPNHMPTYDPQYLHLLQEMSNTRNDVKRMDNDMRRIDRNLLVIMKHLGVQNLELEKEPNKNKFGDHVSTNLDPLFQAKESQKTLKRKKQHVEEADTVGQRLRGPAGRKPTPSHKSDFFYPGKERTQKVGSEAKVQSEPEKSETDMYDDYETMSQRDQRRERQGKVHVIPVKNAETDELEEFKNWVNKTHPNAHMVRISSFSITQKHLECLTNPKSDDKLKYLGDEVIDAFIEHYKLSTPQDIREDGSVFVEGVVNTFTLENDGRKNAKVRIRMGGSRKGLDYIINQLIFLPMHMKGKEHWYLVCINTRTQFIQILNSITHAMIDDEETHNYLKNTLRGMESHIEYALQRHGHDMCTWTYHP